MLSHTSASLALLLLMVRGLPAQDSSQVAHPHRCLLERQFRESRVAFARRCAEDFIKRSGYTTAPVEDTSLVGFERIQFGTVKDILNQRHGTLRPTAESVHCSKSGCSAVFHYADSSLVCVFRILTMKADFTELRVQHQGATYAPGTAGARRCAER